MEDGRIADPQISASSETTANHAAKYGRLHSQASAGAWSSGAPNTNQWLQVDLAVYTLVTGVATQGRYGYSQWVTKYKLQYGLDALHFKYYKVEGQTKVKDKYFRIIKQRMSDHIRIVTIVKGLV